MPELRYLENTMTSTPTPTPAPNRQDIMRRPPYVPIELQFSSNRRGAYDAFNLPSLMFNERRPHKNTPPKKLD